MADLKLLKEPGYVCDLMLLFFLHFNEECTENFINKNKAKETDNKARAMQKESNIQLSA